MKKYILFFTVVSGGIYIAQKTNMQLPKLVNNYINDFLIVPIVSFICLTVIRKLRNQPLYKLPIGVIIYISVLYSVIFELILPQIHSRYTSDLFDILLYFLGGLFFYLLQKRE